MKILLVSSEVAPYAKTGGLADVAGSLPRALRQLGHDVRIIMPCYKTAQEKGFSLRKGRKSVEVAIGGTPHKGMLRQTTLDSVPVYLIENRDYFERTELYGTGADDYPDNAERFGFFCRAVLEFLRRMDFRPDILHLNDWQTGLIPVLLRTELRDDPFFAGMRTVLTIHNLGYQGLFPPSVLPALGLDPAKLMTMERLEYYGQASFLKGGVLFADRLNTVSETYCREIQTPEMGLGFDGILRQRTRHLSGILNGIDPKQWDPALDPALANPYQPEDLRGKAADKKVLQRELGLTSSVSTPIVAMVTRLDVQKGLDLVEEAWPELMKRDLQFVLLGSGEEGLSRRFARLGEGHPGRTSIALGFDDALARRIYAGSDLFLMPSRYEPCGLGQLIALRYGAVPVVRRTGGLADTIVDPLESQRRANGFSFAEPSATALLAALDRALTLYQKRRSWLRLVKFGMEQDFSWARSAHRYVDLYRQAMENGDV
jgi:starch synthase